MYINQYRIFSALEVISFILRFLNFSNPVCYKSVELARMFTFEWCLITFFYWISCYSRKFIKSVHSIQSNNLVMYHSKYVNSLCFKNSLIISLYQVMIHTTRNATNLKNSRHFSMYEWMNKTHALFDESGYYALCT